MWRDTSYVVPAGSQQQGPDLPPGVWRDILEHLPPLQRFVASMVCKAWRSHALTLLTPNLSVCLNSGACLIWWQLLVGLSVSGIVFDELAKGVS